MPRALAADVGFSYVRSPRGFDHVTQTTVVDASGKVYRQIYGDAFPTPALVEPLKELIYGTAAGGTGVRGPGRPRRSRGRRDRVGA